jgi:hypothetical protein
MAKFDPNQATYAEGAVRVERAVRALKVDLKSKIVTSRDPAAEKLKQALPIRNVPDGFEKWQLPFVFDKGLFFVTHAKAGVKAAEHFHDEGDGIRFIVSGSIHFNKYELTAGDWMFIPARVPYSFEVGKAGAVMCYCYCCCCAGAADIKDWLVDPPPDVLQRLGLQ